MTIRVLYHAHYFQRDLFLLSINETHYTTVYRGSGLNAGRKGRILPYTSLKDTQPRFGEAREGIVPGYIFKEFFYRGFFKSHHKDLSDFPDEINQFTLTLESLLNSFDCTLNKRFESDDDFNNILNIAKEINTDMKKLITENQLKNFDWVTLATDLKDDSLSLI